MTLDEFCAWLKDKSAAADFREMWMRGHESDPQGYPLEFKNRAEWLAQYFTYMED